MDTLNNWIPRTAHSIIVWFLFFLICTGLGYAALKRYDPRTTVGMTDVHAYYRMVQGEPLTRPRADVFAGRILVPFLARPFYRLLRRFDGSFDPVLLALLIVNSAFCATAAFLLVQVTTLLRFDFPVGLVAALLYLSNFNIANAQLAGLVDAGEACFIVAVVLSLLAGRWWLLPLWSIPGVMAKETFLPIAAVIAFVWWLTSKRDVKKRSAMVWIALQITVAVLVMVLIHWIFHWHLVWPWTIGGMLNSSTSYFGSFLRCISEPGFWYVFCWLLPLGFCRLRSLPRPWVFSSIAAAIMALILGVLNDMGGNVGRPIFNITGSLFSVSASIFLLQLRTRNHMRSIQSVEN